MSLRERGSLVLEDVLRKISPTYPVRGVHGVHGISLYVHDNQWGLWPNDTFGISNPLDHIGAAYACSLGDRTSPEDLEMLPGSLSASELTKILQEKLHIPKVAGGEAGE